jgi:hypothetical protein
MRNFINRSLAVAVVVAGALSATPAAAESGQKPKDPLAQFAESGQKPKDPLAQFAESGQKPKDPLRQFIA